MRLMLSITAAPAGTDLTSRDIDGVCSIGRDSSSSDWVLPDRTREVSGRHCVLSPAGDRWTVTGHSLNGTFLNNEVTRIGRSVTRDLHNGDQLKIGDYVIEVRHGQDSDATPADTWWDETTPMGKPAPMPELTEPTIKSGPQPPMPPAETQDNWDFELLPRPDAASPKSQSLPRQPILDSKTEWDAEPIGAEMEAGDIETLVQPPPRVHSQRPVAGAAPAAAMTKPSPTAELADAAALAAFLRGAGLSDVTIADPTRAMEALGAAVRAFVSGVRSALESRNSIWRGFHIDETRMLDSGGDPLNLRDSDEAALVALLGVNGDADMVPAAAVAQVLRDIRLHELALVGAMPRAIHALMEALAPEQIQSATETNRIGISLPVLQKARAFEAYQALHARTTQTLENSFNNVFGKAFASAYERTLLDGKLLEGVEPTR